MDGGDIGAGECAEFTEYVVTRWYRAPEVMLLPKKYTPAVDLWSVGCIIAEMLTKKPLFPGRNHIDMVCRISAVCGTPTDEDIAWVPEGSEARRFLKRVCPPGRSQQISGLLPKASKTCLELTHNLLGWDPAKRFTAKKAQEHEYLKHFLPRVPPVEPEAFDWTFDKFKPTVQRVQERLYAECARLHPEIVARDYQVLVQRGFFRDGSPPEAKPVVSTDVSPRAQRSGSHSRSQSHVSVLQRQSSRPPTGQVSEERKMCDISPPMRSKPASFQPPVRSQGYSNSMVASNRTPPYEVSSNRTPPRMRAVDRLFQGPHPIPAMASVQG